MKRQTEKSKEKVPYWSQLGTCHSPYAGIVEESLYRKHCTSVGSVFPVGKKSIILNKQISKKYVSSSVRIPK